MYNIEDNSVQACKEFMDFFVDLESFLSKRQTPLKYIVLVGAFLFFLFFALLVSVINGNYFDFIAAGISGIIAWSFSKEISKLRDRMHLMEFQKNLATNGLDASNFAFFIFSVSGKCVFLNRIAQQLFPGFKIRSVEDLIVCFGKYPKIVDAIKELQHAANGQKQSHIDVPVSLTDGNTVLWRISVAPVPNEEDFVEWTIVDLTPSDSTIKALEMDPCFLLNVINNSNVGYCTINSKKKIIFCNNMLTKWSGNRSIIDRNITDVIAYKMNGNTENSVVKNAPMKVQLNFGTHENLIAVKIMEDNSGNETYIFTQEIEQAAELINVLNTTKIYFEHIFEYAPVGIMVTRGAEIIATSNRAFKEIVGVDHVEDTSLIDYVLDEYKESVRSKMYDIIGGLSTVAPFEIQINMKNNRSVMVYISKIDDNKRTKDSDGLIVYLIDVTARKALQQQFVQSQKMQAVGQLAGGIAHDFNNLLTAMIGYCDLLLEKFLPSDRSFTDIMQIKQNATRASNLVRQLLAFSRQQNMQPKILDVGDMVSELSVLLKRLLGVKIELKVKHGTNVGSIRVDQIQFEQVIINLAVNARDAMVNGGTLNITTSVLETTAPKLLRGDTMPPGSYILIEVSDTGCGIDEKFIERIFDPFFSTKEKGHGTGLGLSTVYGIVHQTGGFISVESQLGVGTTFSLYFKRVSDEDVAQNNARQVSERELVDLTGAGTILLVEDEDAVRTFSARALRNKGYTVIEAQNGEAALEYIKKNGDQINLVISDVVMPKMDGPTLMTHIQKCNPKMKVIFISGYTEDAFRESLANNSDVHFLSKPFNLKQLAMKVKEVIGR